MILCRKWWETEKWWWRGGMEQK